MLGANILKKKRKNQHPFIIGLLLLSLVVGQWMVRRQFAIPCRSPLGGAAEAKQIVRNLLDTHGGLPKTRTNTYDLWGDATYPVHHWEITKVTARDHTDWGGIDDPWYLETEHDYYIFVDVEFEDEDEITLRMGGTRTGFVVCPFIPGDVGFITPMGISVEANK